MSQLGGRKDRGLDREEVIRKLYRAIGALEVIANSTQLKYPHLTEQPTHEAMIAIKALRDIGVRK